MAAIRRRVSYTGRVQGVGFRYTTCRIAQRYAVTGWVRNEPDGSVMCVAEGERDEVERFIKAVHMAMSGNIEQMRQSDEPADGSFAGFHVRR